MLKNILHPKHYLLLMIIISCLLYAWQLNLLPLTAYDEAVYAQVARETLASDNILTLKYFGQSWFEKPPLYFWLTMGLNNWLGEAEYIYRLLSVLAAILTIALTYLISEKLTNNKTIAALASLVLLFMPYYYLTARQVRLDFPVLAVILLGILIIITGKNQSKKLFWLWPIIAIGFMFKSVIALLAFPLLLIFSFFYQNWSWIKEKYLWYGLPLSLIIVLPWHWQQHLTWGSAFWSSYLGNHVIGRFEKGFGLQPINYLDYLPKLWEYAQPWWQIFLLMVLIMVWWKIKNHQHKINPFFLSSAASAFFIIVLFSMAKTHIPTYLLPAYPFMAMVIAYGGWQLFNNWSNKFIKIILIIILLASLLYSATFIFGFNNKILNQLQFPFDYNLKTMGLLVKADKDYQNLYQFNWPTGETISFYANKRIITIQQPTEHNIELIGPFYLMTTQENLPFFFQNNGEIKPEYSSLRIRYYENNFFLLYNADNLVLTK